MKIKPIYSNNQKLSTLKVKKINNYYKMNWHNTNNNWNN